MSRDVSFNPKLTSDNFSNFQAEEISPFSKCFRHLKKKVAAAPWWFNFAKVFSKHLLRIKTKSREPFKHDRFIGFRITAVKLMVWARESQPDRVKGQKYLQKICSGVHYFFFFCQTLNFFNLVSIVLGVITLVIK